MIKYLIIALVSLLIVEANAQNVTFKSKPFEYSIDGNILSVAKSNSILVGKHKLRAYFKTYNAPAKYIFWTEDGDYIFWEIMDNENYTYYLDRILIQKGKELHQDSRFYGYSSKNGNLLDDDDFAAHHLDKAIDDIHENKKWKYFK